MALTKNDLLKISRIITQNNKNLKEVLATSEDLNKVSSKVNDLLDIVVGIRDELDTEHEFRFKLLENTVDKVSKIEKRLNLH